MMRYFVIHGEPVAKGRPRFNRSTGRAFTPQKTINYETLVKMEYLQAYPNEPLYSGDTALAVHIDVFVPIPSSASKKKHQDMVNGIIRPTKKPDADNLIKALMDAGNGVIWEDDKSVVEVILRKWYGEVPHVEMIIDEAELPVPF